MSVPQLCSPLQAAPQCRKHDDSDITGEIQIELIRNPVKLFKTQDSGAGQGTSPRDSTDLNFKAYAHMHQSRMMQSRMMKRAKTSDWDVPMGT